MPKRTITKDDLRHTVAKNLRETRESFDFSQADVAELFNPPLSRAAIGQWEVGDTLPDIDRLAVLSKAYGVTIDSLVFGDDYLARDIPPEALKFARKFMELTGKNRALIVSFVQSLNGK